MNCFILEKVSWNDNVGYASTIYMSGTDIRASRNLKEIHINDSDFERSFKQEMSNLNNPAFNDRFIFHNCCRTLERVSICNGIWSRSVSTIIPQNALTKFVRNVSSIRWFRSDSTQQNYWYASKRNFWIKIYNWDFYFEAVGHYDDIDNRSINEIS